MLVDTLATLMPVDTLTMLRNTQCAAAKDTRLVGNRSVQTRIHATKAAPFRDLLQVEEESSCCCYTDMYAVLALQMIAAVLVSVEDALTTLMLRNTQCATADETRLLVIASMYSGLRTK